MAEFKNLRIITAIVYDAFLAFFCFAVAIFLRFESLDPLFANKLYQTYLLIFACSQIVFFKIHGLYQGIWRFSSTPDLIRILKACTYGTIVPLAVIFVWNRFEGFPRSVFIIDYILLVVGLGGGRFLYRIWKDNRKVQRVKFKTKKEQGDIPNILVVGAGSAGNQLVREILTSELSTYNVTGIIDDNPFKHGRTIQGVKVLGDSKIIPSLVKKKNISKIFIAIPTASSEEIRKIVNICENTDVEFKTLPKLNDILNGKVELSQLRNLNLEDLLGRAPVRLDNHKLESMISNQTVVVTGAGGSIGSEICRQISEFRPKKVILFEICELFLYELEMELREKFPKVDFVPVIGDVRFRNRVASVFKEHQPDLVLHAAAYKHVPMMEANPLESILTNVLGTKIVAELAAEHRIKKFIMISTDKAVNPTNIMGSTKRIAEKVCLRTFSETPSTKFITVRFGNVLGSNGSVIPLFKKQIENGGPVTVTHPEINRYFMSIPEACQLVLQAATMGNGGEIFVLDMGDPVKILDLAKDLIKLSGFKPEEDIEIKFTGLRPGEKLYEELFSDAEELLETDHEKVKKAKSIPLESNFTQLIENLLALSNESTHKQIYETVKDIVTEFNFEQTENRIN